MAVCICLPRLRLAQWVPATRLLGDALPRVVPLGNRRGD